jgi:hypothetical protein
MISNSNGIQISSNHFLVGPNIALQYLGHLLYFSKMLKWPIYFCNGKEKRKGKGIKGKGQSQTGPSAQCTGPAQLARSLFSLPLRVTFLLAGRPRAGERPTRRRPPTEQGRGRIRAAPVPFPLASSFTPPLSRSLFPSPARQIHRSRTHPSPRARRCRGHRRSRAQPGRPRAAPPSTPSSPATSGGGEVLQLPLRRRLPPRTPAIPFLSFVLLQLLNRQGPSECRTVSLTVSCSLLSPF